MAEKDESGYIVRLALFLDDNGPCPRASDYGLTFDEAKRCEYDALMLSHFDDDEENPNDRP